MKKDLSSQSDGYHTLNKIKDIIAKQQEAIENLNACITKLLEVK